MEEYSTLTTIGVGVINLDESLHAVLIWNLISFSRNEKIRLNYKEIKPQGRTLLYLAY